MGPSFRFISKPMIGWMSGCFTSRGKFNCACQQVVIGESQGRHAIGLCCLHQIGGSHQSFL